jgi:chromosome segregation ATPase
MRHDSTREIDAAVREATAALHEIIADLRADRDLATATIMELRAEIESLRSAAKLFAAGSSDTIGHMHAERIELRDHLSQAHASLAEMTARHDAIGRDEVVEGQALTIAKLERALAEMTRCTTAGQLQAAKERQQGTTYPRHVSDGTVPNPHMHAFEVGNWSTDYCGVCGCHSGHWIHAKERRGASRGTFGREDLIA